MLFEGLIGVLDGELQEIHYSDLKDDGKRITKDSTGGWLGFTDKYWATTLIPDSKLNVTATFQHTFQNGRDVYQADYVAQGSDHRRAGRQRRL